MTAPTDRPHPLRPQRSLDLPELRRALEGWLQQGWLPERELCVGWFGLPLPALDVDGRPSAPLRLPGLRLVLAATPQVGSDEAPAAAPTTPAIPAPPPGLLLASPAPQDSELALLDLLITGDAHLALRADALARPIWWIDRADAPSEPPSTPQLRRFPADTADMPGAALAAALAMWASTHSPARRPLAGCLDEQQAVVAAIAAFQQGDQRGATLAARNLLVAAPQRSDLWHLLGLVAQQAGDLPQAHACFSHVTRLTPGYLEGWRCLSLSCLARGAADDALQAVQHGVALAPGDAGLRALHARILQALGLTHLAATEADNALALAPDDLNALLARAHSSQLLGQPDQAIALYQQALPRHPASLELQFRLGQALLRAGRSDQAQLHLAHVVDATQPSQPLHRQALLQLIDAQADCGALQPAAASARQALALDPADLAALRRCASLERRTGGRARALQALAAAAQALGRLPTDLAALQAQLEQETGAHLLAPPSSPTGTARTGTAPVHPQGAGSEGAPAWRLLDALHHLAHQPDWREPAHTLARHAWSAAIADHPQPLQAPLHGTARSRPARLRVAYLVGQSDRGERLRWAQALAAAHDPQTIDAWTGHWGAFHGQRPDPTERADETALRHIDLTGWPEPQAARHLADLAIDMLVDLEGCNLGQREGILLRHPARWQLGWQALCGPLAPPCYDALLSDRLDAPALPTGVERAAPHPWPLPHGWMLLRASAPPRRLERAALGLPPRAPVLTCAAEPQWLHPRMLQIWMRLLQAIPTAALWLPAWPQAARQALLELARSAGIAPQRLRHMPRELTDLPAALTLADLHLAPGDTGGETALAQALAAGIPALACSGSSSPALLRDAGQPAEHFCPDLSSYEARALTLLRQPRALLALRRHAEGAAVPPALFDIHRHARQLEAVYTELMERPPQSPPHHPPGPTLPTAAVSSI